QVIEHRRTLRRSDEQLFEFAERVRANCVALIRGGEPTNVVFVSEDVEVIEPEINHHLLQLALAENSTQQLGLLQFNHWLLRVTQRRCWSGDGASGLSDLGLFLPFFL